MGEPDNFINRSNSFDDNRDLEKGDILPPPSPLSRTFYMSNSGKTLLVSSPTPTSTPTPSSRRLKSSESAKSFGSYSFKNISTTKSSYDTDGCASPSTPPTVIMSNTGKALAVSSSAKSFGMSNSSKSLALSGSGKSFSVSGSGKRMDQKRKYVKQVTGKHKDTELHLAAQKGDVEAVAYILGEIDAQMMGTSSGVEFDTELAEIRWAIVNEVNELGETPLFRAAEKGHLDVVRALLPYATPEGICAKNQVGFTALHVAAGQGHEGRLHFAYLCMQLVCY